MLANNGLKEVYFVDSAVSDISTLLSALPETADVHVLESGSDGLDQILSHLHHAYRAIHILCHGAPGRLTLGSSSITAETLNDRATDFVRLGRALVTDGDLLLYGCNVAQGDVGRAFVGRIADLTGAEIAASETLTGADALGGNWRLEVRHGLVQTPVQEIAAYQGVFTAPTLQGPSPLTFEEGGDAQLLQGLILQNGLGYAGGSLRIEVASATADDQLVLTSDADVTVMGAISVDAGVVYLGNGGGKTAIGTVDATENGQNGADLLIHFTAEDTGVVQNPGFESGVTGWTVGESRVMLGTTVINGHTTPTDSTVPPKAGGDTGSVASMTYDSEVSGSEHTEGGSSLRLFNTGTTTNGFEVVHGPYAYSNTFAASAGDTFHFDWQAKAGGDAYDAFGYLMNADTGEYIVVINQTGADDTGVQDWTTASVTVPEGGNYFFAFVSGTYDFTGLKGVGGSLFIDNFRVEASPVNDDVIEAIAANVSYENTADAPPADPRTLTVTVTDGVGAATSAEADVTVTNVNDVLTGGVSVTGEAEQGATLTASNDISDPDGMGAVGYQWQRADGEGGWADIAGATAATYDLTQADVGFAVRAIASYTDGGGEAESFTSNTTTAVADAQLPGSGGVAVTGAATQGATLTASHTLADPDGMGAVTYQWQRADGSGGWIDISGATGSGYQLTQADVGLGVRAVGSYTDGDGQAVSVASSATAATADVNDAPTGAVIIAGDVEQGAVLTASNTIADADGLGAISYHWERQDGSGGWVDIADATGSTYQLTQDDVGLGVRAVATYTDNGGGAETVVSAASAAVANINDDPSGAVSVTGEVEQGATLTASNTLADADGMGAVTYQWQRSDGAGGWIDIADATGTTYGLTQADVGVTVRAVASYTDAGGAAETRASGPTTVVADGQFGPTGDVSITGDAEQGAILTASNDISDPDGMGAVTYQWQRADGSGGWIDIDGATAATYQLTQGEVGLGVRAVASYTDGDGQAQTVSSSATAATANVNDAPTGAVTVTGSARIGATLQAGDSLADLDGLGPITYQWQADGVDIDGAAGSSLLLTSDLRGKEITVVASYVDGDGKAESVESAPTATVTDPPPSPPPVSTETIDGVTVETGTAVNPDGSTSQVTVIPIVTPSREEIVGQNTVADIPLTTNASGQTQLLAQVPTGLGLQVSGPGAARPAGLSLTDLIREIKAHTPANSDDQQQLTGGGTGFLGGLPTDAPLLVRTIVPTVAPGAGAPDEALVLTGTPAEAGGPQTALVIDAAGLPEGATIGLEHVQFAAVIGGVQIIGGEGDQNVWGDGASQLIQLGQGQDRVHGGAGDDQLHGNVGADTVDGGAGWDLAYGGQGDDVVLGGADGDLIFGDFGNDVVQGNTGQDTVNGGAGADLAYGGQGDDAVLGGADDDLVFGDIGDDYVQGNTGADRLFGGVGSDLLHGGKDNDVLHGEDGDDTLSGDFGDDVLVGGAGADMFMSFGQTGVDKVMDFSASEGDYVFIEPGTTYSLVQQGGDTVVNFGEGHRLVLVDVQLSSLSDGWILGG
jgi:hypothetical protein